MSDTPRKLNDLDTNSLKLCIHKFLKLKWFEFSINANYDDKSFSHLKKKIVRMNSLELRKLRSHELANKRRKSFISAITNSLNEKILNKEFLQ